MGQLASSAVVVTVPVHCSRDPSPNNLRLKPSLSIRPNSFNMSRTKANLKNC